MIVWLHEIATMWEAIVFFATEDERRVASLNQKKPSWVSYQSDPQVFGRSVGGGWN